MPLHFMPRLGKASITALLLASVFVGCTGDSPTASELCDTFAVENLADVYRTSEIVPLVYKVSDSKSGKLCIPDASVQLQSSSPDVITITRSNLLYSGRAGTTTIFVGNIQAPRFAKVVNVVARF